LRSGLVLSVVIVGSVVVSVTRFAVSVNRRSASIVRVVHRRSDASRSRSGIGRRFAGGSTLVDRFDYRRFVEEDDSRF
jgi:hypothetical protein